jgi:predicted AlkP superfamily phosphohydrolase/phosphomutase
MAETEIKKHRYNLQDNSHPLYRPDRADYDNRVSGFYHLQELQIPLENQVVASAASRRDLCAQYGRATQVDNVVVAEQAAPTVYELFFLQ